MHSIVVQASKSKCISTHRRLLVTDVHADMPSHYIFMLFLCSCHQTHKTRPRRQSAKVCLICDIASYLPNASSGAHIMNSLANSLSQTPGSERASQAETWVKKAIAVIDSAKASERDPEVIGQCEAVLVAALFNMGSLREVRSSLRSIAGLTDAFTLCRWPVHRRRLRSGTNQVMTKPWLCECEKGSWSLSKLCDD